MLPRTRSLLALATTVAALAALPAAAEAATIAVTTTDDPASPTCPSPSNCSIRGAVAAAVDGDVVAIPAGTHLITRGFMFVTTGITIQGAGSSQTVIDASGSSPQTGVFRVPGANFAPQVAFRDLAITGGTVVETSGVQGVGGAAIANRKSYGVTVLTRVHLYGNTATLTAAAGGASPDMGGGAVLSQGSLEVYDSLIESNTVTVTRSGGLCGGGAIAMVGDNARLTISASTLRNNTADVTASDTLGSWEGVGDGGGAIHAGNRGGVTISDSTLTGNRAIVRNSYGEAGGGAVYVDLGGAIVTDSTLSDNHADVTATANSRPASNHGGGAAYLDGTNSAFSGVTMTGNTVTVQGAATDTIQDSTNGGGAIYQYGYDIQISGSTLSGNSVTLPAADRSGGGALLDNGESAAIVNTTFHGNVANVGEPPIPSAGQANGGGAILVVSVRRGVTLAGVTIAGNRAPSAVGGGLLVYQNPSFYSSTTVRITGSLMADNTSASAASGNCALSSTPENTRILSLGYNLATDAANSCGFTATGDLIAQPQLVALADNGGPTRTMALPAGSPAVDAGDPAGCADADGGPLLVDQRGAPRPAAGAGRCDIGAYELSLPSAVTDPVALVSATGAMLAGTAANPDALGATTWFEYGTTTAYGAATPAVALAALAPAAAHAAAVTGLSPATTYHVRAVTRSAAGTAYGADRTFTTADAIGIRVTLAYRAASPRRIDTRVTVGSAGRLRQTGTVRLPGGRTVRVCVTTRAFTRARATTVSCTIPRARHAALARADRRVRVTTVFTPLGGRAVTFRATVILPHTGSADAVAG